MSDKQPLVQPPPPAYNAPPPMAPPPQQAYPPPAYGGYQAAPATHNNTVIVTQPAPVHTTYRTYRSGDHYLSLSIFLTICCFFWGTWCALACTIPAIVFAINARDAEARGDAEAVGRNRRLALGLNIGGIVTYVVTIIIIIIIAVSVNVTAASSGYCYYYYDSTYGYYYSYCYSYK